MTYFPEYLKTYPNMDSASPLHISKNTLPSGFRQHRHNFLEFSYVVEGVGSETINDVAHTMSPGAFTFILPYQVHELVTAPGGSLVLYNCMFSMDLLMETATKDGLSGLLERDSEAPYIQLQGEENDTMRALIEDLYREYKSNEMWRSMMLQIRLKEILILFDRLRRRQAGRSQRPVPAAAATGKAAVWPIIHYIHQHYQDDLALSELAGQFAMSASRISEVIKHTTGQTFLHFLHDLRIRHACSLLSSTEMSVSEIALEVGYGSYNTFSRVFRDTKGVVPKEYRRRKQAATT